MIVINDLPFAFKEYCVYPKKVICARHLSVLVLATKKVKGQSKA